jgi:hypothetical protein
MSEELDDNSLIIPIIIIIGVIIIIALFFYKRAINEFRINQVETLEKAYEQHHERIPCVVSEFPTPHSLWTAEIVRTRPSLAKYTVENGGIQLRDLLGKNSAEIGEFDAAAIADQCGVALWTAHTLLPPFKSSTTFGTFYSASTGVYIGTRGLHKTVAPVTLIFPTDNDITVSIMHEQSDPYLPADWQGRHIASFTPNDTPLIGHIDYMDIIVRPQNALMLPAHWKYCIKSDAAAVALYSIVEFHHPLSKFINRTLAVRGLK